MILLLGPRNQDFWNFYQRTHGKVRWKKNLSSKDRQEVCIRDKFPCFEKSEYIQRKGKIFIRLRWYSPKIENRVMAGLTQSPLATHLRELISTRRYDKSYFLLCQFRKLTLLTAQNYAARLDTPEITFPTTN